MQQLIEGGGGQTNKDGSWSFRQEMKNEGPPMSDDLNISLEYKCVQTGISHLVFHPLFADLRLQEKTLRCALCFIVSAMRGRWGCGAPWREL